MLYKAFPTALKEATFQKSDLLPHFATRFLTLTFKLQFIIDHNT